LQGLSTAAKIYTMLRVGRGDEGLHAAEYGRIGNRGAAVAIARGSEGGSEIIAEERDVGAVRPIAHVERAARCITGIARRLHFVGSMSAKSIVPWPVIPATVPVKLEELRSSRMPVDAVNDTCPK
jgi:hypothetical protein